MTTNRTPPVGCQECGSVVENAVALEFWVDAMKDAAIQRRQKRELQAQRDKNVRAHTHYEVAMGVLRYWRDTCRPHAKELENERLTLCLARLDAGSTPEQLKLAVYGYSLKPFVVNGRRTHEGPRDSWQADATLIFRGEPNVARGIDIAERAGELTQAFSSGAGGLTRPIATGPLSGLGEAALKVARSYPVFPVYGFRDGLCTCGKPADADGHNPGKHPMTKHGLLDAKKDPDSIRRFWSRAPDANIGVPTGEVSGVVVLDIDGEEGWEALHRLEDKYDSLPTTLSVKTPRGGEHLYFQHPGVKVENSASLLGQALDVRGDGGYVLVPPSVGTGGREYSLDDEATPAPLPTWVVELIQERQRKISEALRSGELEVFFKTGASQGNRNERLFRFACSEVRRRTPSDAAFVIHGMNKAWLKPPLDDREVDQIVKSALRQKDRP